MTSLGPEDAGGEIEELEKLIAALGDRKWTARKRATEILAKRSAPDIINQVLHVFREQHRDLSRLNSAIQILAVAPADVVPVLVELLQVGDADVRGYSALALGLRGDPRAIPALIDALDDADINVRVQAIEALGALQAAAAVDRIIEIVEPGNFELAFPALDALRHIGDGRIAHRLVPLLEDTLLSEPAVEALGELGDEECVPVLLEMMGRQAARSNVIAGAIVQIRNRLADLYECGSEVEELVRSLSTQYPIAQRLHRAISESPTDNKAPLLTLYSWLPESAVDETLVRLLDSPELHDHCIALLTHRRHTVETLLVQRMESMACAVESEFIVLLGRLGDPRFVPALLPLLACEQATIVAAALDSLARIRDERNYQPAKELLRHPNLMVRDGAVAVLNSSGKSDLPRDLEALLQDPHPLVRESAVKVASYLGFSDCLDIVFELCSDPVAAVRQAAVAHLPCLEDRRVSANLTQAATADTPRVRATAAGALASVGGQQAIAVLARTLEDPDAWVRYKSVRSLAKLDGQLQFGDRLASIAMSDSAMQVQIAAAGELARYGASILPVLGELSRHANEDLAQAAISALGELQLAESVPLLTACLESDTSRLQIAALRALGATRQASALAALRNMAERADSEVVPEAIAAIGALGSKESCEALLWLARFPRNRSAVIDALLPARPAQVEALIYELPLLPLDVSRCVIEALSRRRTPAAFAGLEVAVVDSRPAIRFAAVAALSHCSRRTERKSFLPVEGGR